MIFVQGSRKAEKWKVFFRYPKPTPYESQSWLNPNRAISKSHLSLSSGPHSARLHKLHTSVSYIYSLCFYGTYLLIVETIIFLAQLMLPHTLKMPRAVTPEEENYNLWSFLSFPIFFLGGTEWNCVLFFCIIPPAELLGRRWRQKKEGSEILSSGFRKKKCTEYCT